MAEEFTIQRWQEDDCNLFQSYTVIVVNGGSLQSLKLHQILRDDLALFIIFPRKL